MTIEPSPQSCLIRAYTALQALDMASAEQHITAGFQHVLHKWCARAGARRTRALAAGAWAGSGPRRCV